MKKYYALVASILAVLAGSTSCFHFASDYGAPVPRVDEDQQFYDDETEPDVIQTDTDTAETDDYNETIMPCSETNKFCNEHDGLYWSDFHRDITWEESAEYCENLEGRLPTISDLRTLVKNCQMIETDGACKITDECLSFEDCYDNNLCGGCGPGKYSVFGYDGTFWSSSKNPDNTDSVWVINFNNAHVFDNSINTTQTFSAVCIKK